MTTIASYGSWKSPITPDLIVQGGIGLGQIALDGEDVYWSEQRPSEGGRNVIVRRTSDGQVADVTPPPFNARTRVHEYGGGAFMAADGIVYFSNFADQRLYRQAGRDMALPLPITPAMPLRYADGIIDRRRNRMICVREDHRLSDQDAVNTLVSMSLDLSLRAISSPEIASGAAHPRNDTGLTNGGQVLVMGNDFYSSPRLSPDGARLAWLTWNHPNMPWDGTELWVGELDSSGMMGQAARIAGGADESIFQPEWSPDGVLHFISDRTGWWNLYRLRHGRAEPLCPMEAEFGKPQWQFGASTFGFESANRIICSYTQNGNWYLASLDTATGTLTPIDLPYSYIWDVRVKPGQVVFGVASSTEPPAIVRLDLASRELQVLRRSSDVQVDGGYLSIPQAIEFPTEHGLTAHGFFYAPRNRDFAAPSDELPPLIVFSHGGPTGATASVLNLNIQYWTSRGLAVLDVNYGGSTGYGRAYRHGSTANGAWWTWTIASTAHGTWSSKSW